MKRRIGAFVGVGAVGFVLQISALTMMTAVGGWPYRPAAALAVELAVVNNFIWHQRWTWRDRQLEAGVLERFLRYQLVTGLTSIVGNVACTIVLVEALRVPVVAANAAAVAAMSAVNFLFSDRWVFTRAPVGAALLLALAGATPVFAAELRPETLAAWDKYVADAEAQFDRRSEAGMDPEGDAIGVPGGTIHHWRGSTIIRGTTVAAVVEGLMNPGTPPPQEDVLEARVLGRSGDTLRVYLKLVRHTLITVTYDTEHQMSFWREGPDRARGRSVATRIAEAGGKDRGFLWRLNSYWRYTQVGKDVRVDLESVSLSRPVPGMIRPVAGPIINRIARESLTRTLDAMRDFFEGGRTLTTRSQ